MRLNFGPGLNSLVSETFPLVSFCFYATLLFRNFHCAIDLTVAGNLLKRIAGDCNALGESMWSTNL